MYCIKCPELNTTLVIKFNAKILTEKQQNLKTIKYANYSKMQ